jgi:hypothetical protein
MSILERVPNNFSEGIWKVVLNNIEKLSMRKCGGCEQMEICDSNKFNDSRYCLSLIEAAIKCQEDFEITI